MNDLLIGLLIGLVLGGFTTAWVLALVTLVRVTQQKGDRS